jgi:predicted DNA-binding antitoxin AbrB/MazE fold protein
MQTVRAVFENGIFRPTNVVTLPEHATVEFEPRLVSPEERKAARDGVYAILSERYASGEKDVAERHDEHQP